MNKPLYLVLLLLFCSSKISFAQNKKPVAPVFKYGKIDPKEFDTKVSGQDSAAAAIKIFDIGKGYFEVDASSGGLVYVFERHT